MNIAYDLTRENALLGMMLLEQKYAIEGILNLKEEDFGDENNRLIFKGLKKLSENGEPLEIHSLCSVLRKEGNYEKIGGGTTLMITLGIIIGLIGIVIVSVNYPLYSIFLRKRKEKYSSAILLELNKSEE